MGSPLDPEGPVRTPLVRTRCDPDERLADRLVEVVAAVVGDPPLKMTPPLGAVVDLEALNLLVGRSAAEGARVAASFAYGDFEVVVGDDRTIRVYEADAAGPTGADAGA